MSFWADKRMCVTSKAGFLGSSIVEKLKSLGAKEIFVPRVTWYLEHRQEGQKETS
jgi:hypothetical protein